MVATTTSLLYSGDLLSFSRRSWRETPNVTRRFICSNVRRSARYAILGAGFAGLSVAWHLLQHSSKESGMSIDIYDESGIGGGASGVSGGLLHPYSPKGKLLWRASESWKECLKLLTAAERAVELSYSSRTSYDHSYTFDGPIILRRGILKPATSEMKVEILKAAMNIHPKRYLQALLLACKNFAAEVSSSARAITEISLLKKHVNSLHELGGDYDAVVICLGAKAGMLPELSGTLPLRNCRGIIAELELPPDVGEYRNQSPSILSDAWLAFQGPRNVLMGSTWEWKSNNYSSHVASEEAAEAINELLPKVSVVYPAIDKWEFVGARAGMRAMPPVTPLGSLPLLGCVAGDGNCRYWLVGGLGSRGLMHHGLLGKLMAGAVVAIDEALLPFELISWKSKQVQNQA